MPNNWLEAFPNLDLHEFEIYDNVSNDMNMPTFHSHSFYEFHFIGDGYVRRYTENAVCDMEPGCISIMPPQLFHRVTQEHAKTSSILYRRILLYVSVNFMHFLETDQFKIARIFDDFGHPGDRYLQLNREEMSTFYRPLQQIVRIDRDDEPMQHLQNRAQIMLLLTRLAEYIANNRFSTWSEEPSLVYKVITYINANLSENLSLDSLAARFFVSKFYLAHRFKEYTQLSLHQYVLIRRMIYAQSLLRSGESPTTVAKLCGYREYSSFYKVFLRETGKTPRSFF